MLLQSSQTKGNATGPQKHEPEMTRKGENHNATLKDTEKQLNRDTLFKK